MPESEALIGLVGEWIQKAEDDLTFAAIGLRAGQRCPPGGVCFHAQQCVEKYVKAFLTW